MRTLDEVIFEAPYTMTPWEENAIYYLKKYRDHMKNEIIELQEELKKQKGMIEFLEKPLTWDELKQMEGKPVWMEVKYHNPEVIYKYWTIVKYFDSNKGGDMIFTGTGFYYKDLLGVDWKAYRKEKKDE